VRHAGLTAAEGTRCRPCRRDTERLADPTQNRALRSSSLWRYDHDVRNEVTERRPEIWESAFAEKGLIWGLEPTKSAILAKDHFTRRAVENVLIPGVGYGRNAKVFLEHGMSVTGIEISETAIALARSELGLDIPIHHGSVVDMPYDHCQYDGIFCYGLIYLLDAGGRAKVIRAAHEQLTPGGCMIFTVISKKAPMFGRGTRLGDDWYEPFPGVKMYFYDADSVKREFGPYGLVDHSEIDEPAHAGSTLPFINVVCQKD
jgi:SAM-dependent methyltransferase